MKLSIHRPFRLSVQGLCLALGLIFSSALCQAQQIDLGVAGQYSAFIFGNVSNVTDVEGRLAVGGALNTPGGNIGGKMNPNDTRPALVIGGNLVAYAGSLGSGTNNGFAIYSGTKGASPKVASYLDFRKQDVGPIDFEAERTYLTVLSQQLRAAPATGTVSQLYAQITLTGSNKDIEIFNLTADHVVSTYNFVLANVKQDAYLILNVASNAQRTIKFGISMTAFINRHSKVLINMYDTELLNFNNAGVYGSVLAPFACIKNSGGHLEGIVIAASWDSNMEVGTTLFVPTN
ncbi:choice-of-anchor A family protein [Undibacterium sp. Tian12W]|uniref:choice-of-anchor A family protein n=1 Tax=Undibacterium sp. Tian12W TaxID=3413054 RepID=UPI003BF32DEE